jgi:hypothetical protein
VNHDKGCTCKICQFAAEGLTKKEALDKFLKHEKEQLEKFGWIAHYTDLNDWGVNFHTHGLQKTYNHPDLQIVAVIDMKTAHNIFWNVIDHIHEGEKFKDGDTASGIIVGYKVKFISAEEDGRPVLRIILPDTEGNLDQDKIGRKYVYQYEC